jgi:hypothetical protein
MTLALRSYPPDMGDPDEDEDFEDEEDDEEDDEEEGEDEEEEGWQLAHPQFALTRSRPAVPRS